MSGNKIVRATYYFEDIFKVPSNVDLENKEQVEDWWIRHNTLYIKLKNGNVLDIVSQGYEICMKTPNDEEILDAEDTGFGDEEFEEADLGEADSDDDTFLGEKDTEEVVLKECKVTPEPASNEKFEQMWKAMGLPVASDETSDEASDEEKTYTVRCGFYVEDGDGTIVYNGNDFTEAKRVYKEEWDNKHYEWVELFDENYDEDGPIEVLDKDSEEYKKNKEASDETSDETSDDEQKCECCDSGLPAIKVQGIFVCKKCNNFECGLCGKENEDPHCDIAWNEECGMCVCDCCDDDDDDDETTPCNICLEPSTDKFDMKCDTCKEGYICSDCQNNIVPNGILWADADDVKSAIKCPCCRILNWKNYYSQFIEYGLNYDLEEYEPEEYNNAVQVYLRNKNL